MSQQGQNRSFLGRNLQLADLRRQSIRYHHQQLVPVVRSRVSESTVYASELEHAPVRFLHVDGSQGSTASEALDLDRLRRSEDLLVGSFTRDSLDLIEDLAEAKAATKSKGGRAEEAMRAKQGMLQLVAEYLRPDGGPSRWFSPTDSKPPFPNAPLMLFLPGIDGTGKLFFAHRNGLALTVFAACRT